MNLPINAPKWEWIFCKKVFGVALRSLFPIVEETEKRIEKEISALFRQLKPFRGEIVVLGLAAALYLCLRQSENGKRR